MYKPISSATDVPFGESKGPALASWSDDYETINAVEDDRCIVFVLGNSGKALQWIPIEVIKTFPLPLLDTAKVEVASA